MADGNSKVLDTFQDQPPTKAADTTSDLSQFAWRLMDESTNQNIPVSVCMPDGLYNCDGQPVDMENGNPVEPTEPLFQLVTEIDGTTTVSFYPNMDSYERGESSAEAEVRVDEGGQSLHIWQGDQLRFYHSEIVDPALNQIRIQTEFFENIEDTGDQSVEGEQADRQGLASQEVVLNLADGTATVSIGRRQNGSAASFIGSLQNDDSVAMRISVGTEGSSNDIDLAPGAHRDLEEVVRGFLQDVQSGQRRARLSMPLAQPLEAIRPTGDNDDYQPVSFEAGDVDFAPEPEVEPASTARGTPQIFMPFLALAVGQTETTEVTPAPQVVPGVIPDFPMPTQVFSDSPPTAGALAPPQALYSSDNPQVQASLDLAATLGVGMPNVSLNPMEAGHHGINARYSLQYLGGSDSERRAALAGLQDQILNRENFSAIPVMQQLMLFDAVRRLQTAAPGSREQQQALLDLACLEEGQNPVTLTGNRGLLDTLYPQGAMTPEERASRIDALRTQAQQIVRQPDQAAQQAVQVLARPGASTGERQDAMDTLARVARVQALESQPASNGQGFQSYHHWEQGMQLGQRLRDQLRSVMTGATGVEASPAEAFRTLIASNSPVGQFVRQSLLATPGGAQLMEAAANPDRSVLERALNNPDVPQELRGLLQGANALESLHQQLGGSSPAEQRLLLQALAGTEAGARILDHLQNNRFYEAALGLAETPVRANMLQTLREQQTLISLQRLIAAAQPGPAPVPGIGGPGPQFDANGNPVAPAAPGGNPACRSILDAIAATEQGRNLIAAVSSGNREGALAVIRAPGAARTILTRMSALEGMQQGMHELASTSSNPGDFLRRFGTPEAIEAAQAQARLFAETNWNQADQALSDFLLRSETPTESRQQALDRLDQLTNSRLSVMGNNLLVDPFNWARATHLTTALGEADGPEALADAFAALSQRADGSWQAARFLGVFGDAEQVQALIDGLRESDEDDTELLPVVQDMVLIQNSTNGPEIAQALARLSEQAGEGNELAQRFLLRITGQTDANEAFRVAGEMITNLGTDSDSAYRALRMQIPSATEELNDQRTRRILRGIESESTPDSYNAPIERLRQEAQAGNRQAADWLRWAEMSQQMAALNYASESDNPRQTAQAAMQQLSQLADNGNAYARQALSMLLTGNADQERLQNFYALGNGDVGGDRDHPIFIPDLRDLPADVQSEVRLAAVDSLERQIAAGHPISQQEAAALALALSEIERHPGLSDLNPTGGPLELSLDERIRTILENAMQVPSQRSAVMRGIADIMRCDFQDNLGTRGLADLFCAGRLDPAFAENFEMFNRWAMLGHEPALRVVAAAAGGSNTGLSERAVTTLLQVGSIPERADQVRDALLHSYNGLGDTGRLLATMGRLAGEQGNFNDAVRQALRHGLETSLNPLTDPELAIPLRQSALEGLMHNPQQWQARDVELITQRLDARLVEQLRRVADRIPESLHAQFAQALMTRINVANGSPNPEALHALHALRLFPRAVTVGNVNALVTFGQDSLDTVTNRELARSLERETAVTLMAFMARGDGPAQQRAYEAVGPLYEWHGIGRTDLRDALRGYALGRPMDLNVNAEVARLVYDAGIPRPIAGILRDIGMPGTDAEQFQRQDEALRRVMEQFSCSREEAERRIRQFFTNVTTYNALPEAQRRALGGNGTAVDPRTVAGAMLNGRLFETANPYHFLTQDIPAQVTRLRGVEAAAVAQIQEQIQGLEQERLGVLRAMGERTREGVDIFDRVGHCFNRVFTWGSGTTNIDAYAAQQAADVAAVRALEARVRGMQSPESDLVRHQGAVTFFDVARDCGEWQRLMQNGQTREADMLAVTMWGRYTSPQGFLQEHAPQIWAELTRVGDRPIDRGVFQRLQINEVGQFAQMPTFRTGELAGPNGPSGLNQALTLLRTLRPNMADTTAVRQRALDAVDADPHFASIVQASASFANDMSALFGDRDRGITGMFEAGLEGTRYESFVADVRLRAGNIRAALDSVPQSTVDAAILQIRDLRAAANAATDSETRTALLRRADELTQVVRIFDRNSTENPSMRQQIERMITTVTSGRFDESTFGNWLRRDGIIFIVAIAAAVATVATMGAASPLLVAVVASGIAIVASELTQEVLFRTGSSWGPGEPSRLGAYFDGRPEIDPATGRERPRTFFGDVVLPYARQWAMDTLICLGTMGVGAIASRGITALGARASNFLARNSSLIARAQQSLQRLTTSAATSPTHRTWVRQTLHEFVDECGDEFREEMAETLLQRALGRNSEVLGFLAASGVAMGRGINFRRVTGTNIIGLTDATGNVSLTVDQTRDMALSYEQHGARVMPRADGVSFEIRMPDGGVFIVAPQSQLAATLPSTQRAPAGELAPSTHSHTVANTDTAASRAEAERQQLGDTTWQPTEDAMTVRRRVQEFTAAINSGNYAEALRIANAGGVGPAADRVTQTSVDCRITAADLNNPAVLRDLLGRMQSAGQILPDGNGRYDIRMPRPIVVLTSGASVDLTNAGQTAALPARDLSVSELQQVQQLTAGGATGTVRLANGVEVNLAQPTRSVAVESRALTAAEQEQVRGILDSEPGRRILQEQAFIAMEERLIHLSQLHLGGQVVSPTYARFLAERGIAPNGNTPGNEYYSAFQGPNGARSNTTYEQELVAILYDGGMSVAMIEHHFGRQWAARTPIMQFLGRLESGQPTTTNADRVAAAPLSQPGPLGRTTTSEQLHTQLTQLDTMINSSNLTAAEMEAASQLLRQSLDASTTDVAVLRQQLNHLASRTGPDFSNRMRAITDILGMDLGAAEVNVDALLNPNLTMEQVQAIHTMAQHQSNIDSMTHLSQAQRTALSAEFAQRLEYLSNNPNMTSEQLTRFALGVGDVNRVMSRLQHHDGSNTTDRRALSGTQIQVAIDLLGVSSAWQGDLSIRPIPIAYNNILDVNAQADAVRLYGDMIRAQSEVTGPSTTSPEAQYESNITQRIQAALLNGQVDGRNLVFVPTTTATDANVADIDGVFIDLNTNQVIPVDLTSSMGQLMDRVQNGVGQWAAYFNPGTTTNPASAAQIRAAIGNFLNGSQLQRTCDALDNLGVDFDRTEAGLHYASDTAVRPTPPSFNVNTFNGGLAEQMTGRVAELEANGESARSISVLREALNLASTTTDPVLRQQYLQAVNMLLLKKSDPAAFRAATAGDAVLRARVSGLEALSSNTNTHEVRPILEAIFDISDVAGIGRIARQGIERVRAVNHPHADNHARNGTTADAPPPTAQRISDLASAFSSHSSPDVRRMAAEIQNMAGDVAGQEWTRSVPALLELARTNPARAQEVMQVINERMQMATQPDFTYSSPRIQALADIMTTAGTRPDLHLDVQRIFGRPQLSDVALQHFAEVLKDAPPRPRGAAWDALRMTDNTSGLQDEWRAYEAFTHAINQGGIPGLQDFVLVPSGHRSARDSLGMDFIAINLRTGEAFPIDLKKDAGAAGADCPWALVLSPGGTAPSLNTVMTQIEQRIGSGRTPSAADLQTMGTALNNFLSGQHAWDLSQFHAGDAPPVGSDLFSFPGGRRLDLPGLAQTHGRQLTGHDLMNFEAQLGQMLTAGVINQEIHDYLRTKINEQFTFPRVASSTGVLMENVALAGATTTGALPANLPLPPVTIVRPPSGDPYLSLGLGTENPPTFPRRVDGNATYEPLSEIRIYPDGRVSITGPTLTSPVECFSLQDFIDSVNSNPSSMSPAQHQQLMEALGQLRGLDIRALSNLSPAAMQQALNSNAGLDVLRRGMVARDRQVMLTQVTRTFGDIANAQQLADFALEVRRFERQSAAAQPLTMEQIRQAQGMVQAGGLNTSGQANVSIEQAVQRVRNPVAPRGPLGRTETATDTAADTTPAASIADQIAASTLPAALRGVMSRYVQAHPESAALMQRALRLSEQHLASAGLERVLGADNVNMQRIELAVRHAEVLTGIQTMPADLRPGLEQILVPSEGRTRPNPRQIALVESILRAGPDRLPDTVREYLRNPELIDMDTINTMNSDMRRVAPVETPRPLVEPLSADRRVELLQECFDDCTDLRTVYTAEDIARAQTEAARLLAEHMPGAVPEAVDCGANQIVIRLRQPNGSATVLKFDTRGPSEWRDTWGTRDQDCRIIPFGGRSTHTLGSGTDRWIAYQQPHGEVPTTAQINDFNRQLRRAGRRMGDGGPVEADASQIRVVDGRPVLIDYDAVRD